MKLKEAFPSDYLKADDVSGVGEVYIMGEVKMQEFTDPETKETEDKPVLSFHDQEKTLILNKTNWNRIAELYGDESKNWNGKTIKLRLEKVEAFGKSQDAIRVTKPE